MTFEEVYDEQFRFVWRSLRRLNVPEADLSDAVQEVFLVVHRRLGDFEGRSQVTTWLFRICLRVAKDRRRRAHVRHEIPVAEHDEHAAGGGDATAVLEQQDDLALFDAAMAALDLDQAAVFTLFELEAMTGEQVAATLGIPLGTVYSRLRLGREAFRKAVVRLAARRAGAGARRER